MVDDEVQLRVQGRGLVDVAYVEPLQRQRLDRGTLVEVHVLDAQLDAALVEREHHRVVGPPAARLAAPLGGVPLEALHPQVEHLVVDLLQRVGRAGVDAAEADQPVRRPSTSSALRAGWVKPVV